MKAKYCAFRDRFGDARRRTVLTVRLSLLLNLAFALYHAGIGIATASWWFVTLGAYYIVLGVMRFAAVQVGLHRSAESREDQRFIMRFSGAMLLVLSVVLVGTVILSVRGDVAVRYPEIAMITIAVYAFTKVTLAIIRVVQAERYDPPVIITIRNISLADAAVSIFSLQRSMLVTFDGMSTEGITLMNTLTGSGVSLVVILLAIHLLCKTKPMNQ